MKQLFFTFLFFTFLCFSYGAGTHLSPRSHFEGDKSKTHGSLDSPEKDLTVLSLSQKKQVKVFYQSRLYEVLLQTNPRALAKVEKILTNDFSELVPGVDYDENLIPQGAEGPISSAFSRNLIVHLDRTIEVEGIYVESLKIKGANFDADSISGYNVIEHLKEAGMEEHPLASVPHEQKVHPDGRCFLSPLPVNPKGGMRLKAARDEFDHTFQLLRKGYETAVPLAYSEFESLKSPVGDLMGVLILGLPSQGIFRMADALSRIASYYLPFLEQEGMKRDSDAFRRFQKEFLSLISLQGQGLRKMHHDGFIHGNFHLGNSSLWQKTERESRLFYHDLDGVLKREDLTEQQFFGYILADLRNALKALDRIEENSFYRSLGFDYKGAFLKGYFHQTFEEAKLSLLVKGGIDPIFYQGEEVPLYLLDHPFVLFLRETFDSMISFDPASTVTAVRILSLPQQAKWMLEGFSLDDYLEVLSRDGTFASLEGGVISPELGEDALKPLVEKGLLRKVLFQGSFRYLFGNPTELLRRSFETLYDELQSLSPEQAMTHFISNLYRDFPQEKAFIELLESSVPLFIQAPSLQLFSFVVMTFEKGWPNFILSDLVVQEGDFRYQNLFRLSS